MIGVSAEGYFLLIARLPIIARHDNMKKVLEGFIVNQAQTDRTLARSRKSRTKSISKRGRPTQEELSERLQDLLEYALDMFLECGYEQTTVIAIAREVGMSKRTVYEHYENKDDLFKAAVRRALDRYLISGERLRTCLRDNLEDTLIEVARMRVANASTPEGVKLQRILVAQSYRFPELWAEFQKTIEPSVNFLVELFTQTDFRHEIRVEYPKQTALAFISLVVSGPTRLISSGQKLSKKEIEWRIRFAVQLFLDGVRLRS